MNTRLCILVLLCTLLQTATCPANNEAVLIDTAGKTSHDYRNVIALTRSVGFATTYQDFYSLISSGKIQKCETIFFVADWEVIKNSNNVLVQKCIKSVETQVTSGNKKIALFLPPTITPEQATHFITTLGIALTPEIKPFFESFIKTACVHDIHKGRLYGTTLINTTPTDKFEHEHYASLTDKKTGKLLAMTLPTDATKFDHVVTKTFPLALFFTDEQLHNTYFIANASDYTLCELAENFFANPLSFDLRQERLQAAQRTLQEFYALITAQKFALPTTQDSIVLPQKLTHKFNFDQKKQSDELLKKRLAQSPDYAWILERQLVCAWLEPDDYFMEEHSYAPPTTELQSERPIKTALERGMDFLYDSGINLAWFEFNPELALSSVITKDAQPFLDKVTQLSTAIKKRFGDGKKPLPKFFIGTDITTNFRSNPVAAATKDFFGKSYSKIPCPLDFDGFWKPELLDVFDKLVEKLGTTITIDGIFLDFEMYHAQDQASSYTDFMDFSDYAWKLYADRTKKPGLLAHISVLDRTKYLADNNLFADYFTVLTAEARSIGKKIKQHITSKLPHALIAAYAMTLPASWFYRGIMAGLSSAQRPLILATFNTDFYSHAAWLEKQGIFVIHGTAVMLSKFEKKSDTKLIQDLLTYQPYVWLNRPSRMIFPPEKRKEMWWASESSPLSADELAREINNQIAPKKRDLH